VERRVHILVSGRVQGVWFRAATAEVAKGLGIVGWVRNLPNGSVEIEAQGPAGQISEFIAWCRMGPPRASVEQLEVSDRSPSDDCVVFEVRR